MVGIVAEAGAEDVAIFQEEEVEATAAAAEEANGTVEEAGTTESPLQRLIATMRDTRTTTMI